MKKILITGSIAYDHIMAFDGKFSECFIHEELKHLSISFQTEKHDIYFGGCAPNIAYMLKLLGDEPLIFSVAGNDFNKYKKWLKENKITAKYIPINKNESTAAAYILTDNDKNQITIFSLGAMKDSRMIKKFDLNKLSGVDCAIISPGLPFHTLYFAQYCMDTRIPYIFDPGQSTSALSKDELLVLIDGSRGLIMNSYECEMITKKLNMSLDRIVRRTSFVIKTIGKDGVEFYYANRHNLVPAIPNLHIEDPTGGGDAFRGAFLYGWINGESLKKSCQMGNTAASFALEKAGTQNHYFTKKEFEKRLVKNYG